MGLIVFGVYAVYVIVLIATTWLAYRWAAKRGLPRGRRWLAAVGGFLLVYLPVFWDHIPTVVTHKYYCEMEAGFWVYKTMDQWKVENPSVAETLVANKGIPATRQSDIQSYTDTYILNQRLKWTVKKTGPLLLNRWRWEKEIIDIQTNEVLARYVDFSTGSGFLGGPPRSLKFWMERDHCADGENNMYSMGSLVGNMSKLLKGQEK